MSSQSAVLSCLSISAFLLTASSSQQPKEHRILKAGTDESIRTIDLDAPCAFANEYHRLKADKTKPRVAFIENYTHLHGDEVMAYRQDAFQQSCKLISDQTNNTDAFFDKTHKFFQVYIRDDSSNYNETMTYFAPSAGHQGVMLSFWDELGDFKATVLVYRNNKWLDETAPYLGPFKLTKKDFIIVPQYNHAARVLHFDPHAKPDILPKGWLIWNGAKFEFSTAKLPPGGWRCPDTAPKSFGDLFGRDPEDQSVNFCN